MDSYRRASLGATLLSAVAIAGGCVVSGHPTPSGSLVVLELLVATDGGSDLRFVPAEIVAPARTQVRVTLRNASTQAHNLTFEAPVSAATKTIVQAGESDAVDFLTPAPGRYAFVCTIHLGMSGTLVVD